MQCSNCGQTWFQHHPDHLPPSDEEIQAAEIPENEERADISEPPKRQELDPAVADILRQEAEQEARARELDNADLESQPDLGLDDAEDEDARRARQARERMARMRGEDPDAEVTAAAALGSRRDLLPDIEEINSTLRSAGDRQISNTETATASKPKKSGFKRGFVTVALIAILLAAIYIFAPAISKSVPQLDPFINSFVGTVDQARSWLDGQMKSLAKWLDATAASQSGN